MLLASVLLLATPCPPALAHQEREPRGLILNEPEAFQGYTLFAPLRSGSTYLIDMQGEPVHEWKSELPPGNSVYLLDDGSLLRAVRQDDNPRFSGGGLGGRVQEYDWDGKLLWDFTMSDDQRAHHHDIQPLPNGNVLMIAWEYVTPERALALGRDPEVVGEDGLWPDAVFEIEPLRPDGGRVVWEWHVQDHLIQDRDGDKEGYGDVTEHPERVDVNGTHRDQPPLTAAERREMEVTLEKMRELGYVGDDDQPEPSGRPGGRGADWLHTNSIDYHAEHDLILLSTPRMNEVWIIDHSTTTEEARGRRGGRWKHGGDLLYRWGNPRTYGAAGDEDRALFAQHDAQWIPAGSPGAGNVLIFNNGQGRGGARFSSVVEIALPFDPEQGFRRAAGWPFAPEEPAWTYTAEQPPDFFASFISGCQRLPNGNTLICDGPAGRLFEVTAEGRKVWEYESVFGGELGFSFGRAAGPQRGGPPMTPTGLFRATRLAPDHPALAGRDL